MDFGYALLKRLLQYPIDQLGMEKLQSAQNVLHVLHG